MRSAVEPILRDGEAVVTVSMCMVGTAPVARAMKASAKTGGTLVYAPRRRHVVVTDRRLLLLEEDAASARPVVHGRLEVDRDDLSVVAAPTAKHLTVEHPRLEHPLILFFPLLTRSQRPAVAAALGRPDDPSAIR